jgi:hypothetical protein
MAHNPMLSALQVVRFSNNQLRHGATLLNGHFARNPLGI